MAQRNRPETDENRPCSLDDFQRVATRFVRPALAAASEEPVECAPVAQEGEERTATAHAVEPQEKAERVSRHFLKRSRTLDDDLPHASQAPPHVPTATHVSQGLTPDVVRAASVAEIHEQDTDMNDNNNNNNNNNREGANDVTDVNDVNNVNGGEDDDDDDDVFDMRRVYKRPRRHVSLGDNVAAAAAATAATAAAPRVTVATTAAAAAADEADAVAKAAAAAAMAGDGGNGQTCTICLDTWGNSGTHSIAALKCGHLYGRSCIEKWLRTSAKCPQCNAKARRGDIRTLVASCLFAVDTTERDRLLERIEHERRERLTSEQAAARLRVDLAMCQRELAEKSRELSALRAMPEGSTTHCRVATPVPDDDGPPAESRRTLSNERGGFCLHDTVEVGNGARVLGVDGGRTTLLSSVQRGASWGLLKVSVSETSSEKNKERPVEFLALHTAAIRDVAVSPLGDGRVLSVAQDKTARVTDLANNCLVVLYSLTTVPWSCAWQHDNRGEDCATRFFCGLANSTVLLFDLRCNTEKPIGVITLDTFGPIVSLCFVPPAEETRRDDDEEEVEEGKGEEEKKEKEKEKEDEEPVHLGEGVPSEFLPSMYGGLLVGTLQSGVVFFEQRNGRSGSRMSGVEHDDVPSLEQCFEQHSLAPLLGESLVRCASVSHEPLSRLCLASFRPSKHSTVMQHVVFRLGSRGACTNVQHCEGGSLSRLLTRSRLCVLPRLETDPDARSRFEGPFFSLSSSEQAPLSVCAGDEMSASTNLWDAQTGALQERIVINAPVLDVCPFTVASRPWLAALTDQRLFLYEYKM